ncbi:MAG: hypothetical protein GC154_02240 [bacterium]|nr:hypothetical protein [bacterium]
MRLYTRIISPVLLILFMQTLVSAQPAVEYTGKTEWDSKTATFTFLTSGSMPNTREGFFWKVPSSVKKIVIESNVRVTGGFRVLFREDWNPLTITGKSRNTSVIYGTDEESWTDRNNIAENDKWMYSSVSLIEDSIVYISNLTALNPRGYIFSGYASRAVLHVDSCTLLDTRDGDQNNSDGFAGAAGSSIKNSLISTSDDGIKIYNDITIENVTIRHHRNGAPLQFGWGGEPGVANAAIKNLTIEGVAPDDRYNMAPLTWERGHGGVRNVTIQGLDVNSKGLMYNEEENTWTPAGLFELKPEDCEFNLTATKVNLHGLPMGLCKTKGTISIAENQE